MDVRTAVFAAILAEGKHAHDIACVILVAITWSLVVTAGGQSDTAGANAGGFPQV